MTRRPQPPLLYTDYPHSPMPRRLRFGRWHWEIRDAATGPIIADGDTRTRRAAMRRREKARNRCARRQHIVDISHPPLHPLSRDEAWDIEHELAATGIQIALRGTGRDVELCPLAELDTRQRVHAVRVVQAVTDAPVRWRALVACPIHAGSGVPMDGCTLCARAGQHVGAPVWLRGAVAR